MSETPRVPDPRIERAAEWLYNRDARRTGGFSWKSASELTRDSYRDSAASLLSAIADEPARVEVGAPESADTRQVGADGSYATCGEKDPATGCYCTAIFDHAGPHAASNGKEIVAVWPSDTEEGEGARGEVVQGDDEEVHNDNRAPAQPQAFPPGAKSLSEELRECTRVPSPDEAPSVPDPAATAKPIPATRDGITTEAQDGDVDRGIAPPASAREYEVGDRVEVIECPSHPNRVGRAGVITLKRTLVNGFDYTLKLDHDRSATGQYRPEWLAPEAEGERDEARADEWEIEVCPECGATAEDGPSDCDRCELEGVPLETITVVPKTRAVTLTAERDEARSELRLLTQAHVEAVRELSELRARVERQGEALEAADELADQVDESTADPTATPGGNQLRSRLTDYLSARATQQPPTEEDDRDE